MNSNNNSLSENSIKALLAGRLKDLPVYFYEETDSTNTRAKELITKDSVKSALLVANSQTGGRGRVGHTFHSPKGTGIYMSLIFTPDSLENATHATTKAAVCVLEAVEELYEISPQIKWVNDLYLEGKKICGILTEAVTTGPNKGSLVVGIGINFLKSPVPDDLKDIIGFLPSKSDVSREMLIAKIITLLFKELEALSDNSYIKKYRQASMLTGNDITYFENDIQKTATVLDIDDDAGLVVKLPDKSIKTLRNGEVFTLRKTTG